MIYKQVDVAVSERLFEDGCTNAYDMVVDQLVQEHFAQIVQSKGAILQQFIGNVRLTMSGLEL